VLIAPRKSDVFQDDIYTTTVSGQVAIGDPVDWFLGTNADPPRMNLQEVYDMCRKKSCVNLQKSGSGRGINLKQPGHLPEISSSTSVFSDVSNNSASINLSQSQEKETPKKASSEEKKRSQSESPRSSSNSYETPPNQPISSFINLTPNKSDAASYDAPSPHVNASTQVKIEM
jgi:hypothetical protein